MWLEKMAGSMRFAGRLVPVGGGLRFEGERFCPAGACDARLALDFRRVGAGYVAEQRGPEGVFRVALREVGPVGTMGWGGSAYSGDASYVDQDYIGGDLYGDDSYGYRGYVYGGLVMPGTEVPQEGDPGPDGTMWNK